MHALALDSRPLTGGWTIAAITITLIGVSLSLALATESLSSTLIGRVVSIADGDTLTLLDADNTQHKIRLAGIDAPERGQSVRHSFK